MNLLTLRSLGLFRSFPSHVIFLTLTHVGGFACSWLETTSRQNFLGCKDGSECEIVGSDWTCCGAGNRAKCPLGHLACASHGYSGHNISCCLSSWNCNRCRSPTDTCCGGPKPCTTSLTTNSTSSTTTSTTSASQHTIIPMLSPLAFTPSSTTVTNAETTVTVSITANKHKSRGTVKGKMGISVRDCAQFVMEENATSMLRTAIANMSNVPEEWVQNVSAKCQSIRLLSHAWSMSVHARWMLQKDDVEVSWLIVVDPDHPSKVTVELIVNEFNSKSIAEVTQTVNAALNGIRMSRPYELNVQWKFVTADAPATVTGQSQQNKSDTNHSWVVWIASALCACAGASGLMIWIGLYRKRLRLNRPNSLRVMKETLSQCSPYDCKVIGDACTKSAPCELVDTSHVGEVSRRSDENANEECKPTISTGQPPPLPPGKRFHVFLSHMKHHSVHGRISEHVALSLCDALQSMGWLGFFETDEGISESVVTQEHIQRNVKYCCLMTVVLCDESFESDKCKMEWEAASKCGIPVKCIVDVLRFDKASVLRHASWSNPHLLQNPWIEYTDKNMTVVACVEWLGQVMKNDHTPRNQKAIEEQGSAHCDDHCTVWSVKRSQSETITTVKPSQSEKRRRAPHGKSARRDAQGKPTQGLRREINRNVTAPQEGVEKRQDDGEDPSPNAQEKVANVESLNEGVRLMVSRPKRKIAPVWDGPQGEKAKKMDETGEKNKGIQCKPGDLQHKGASKRFKDVDASKSEASGRKGPERKVKAVAQTCMAAEFLSHPGKPKSKPKSKMKDVKANTNDQRSLATDHVNHLQGEQNPEPVGVGSHMTSCVSEPEQRSNTPKAKAKIKMKRLKPRGNTADGTDVPDTPTGFLQNGRFTTA